MWYDLPGPAYWWPGHTAQDKKWYREQGFDINASDKDKYMNMLLAVRSFDRPANFWDGISFGSDVSVTDNFDLRWNGPVDFESILGDEVLERIEAYLKDKPESTDQAILKRVSGHRKGTVIGSAGNQVNLVVRKMVKKKGRKRGVKKPTKFVKRFQKVQEWM